MGEAIGAAAIGATPADPFPEMQPRLEAYRDRGLTGYEWAETSDRVDPRRWLPSAKSLISVAVAYLTPQAQATARRHPQGGLHGQVSVYSYGIDYHHDLRDRLHTLHGLLEEAVGHPVEAKAAVDTSPLVDRRVAERAGIGWVGKNCMLYVPPYGSFVFLGTLCVDIEIEPAPSEQASHCGTCTRCLEACPTGALLAPGVIDARQCLSYVTQMKGVIPKPYRTKLGRRVWGCDTCQWACPENHGVLYAQDPAYVPQGELAYPELIELLTLSNRAFQRKFGQTAMAWRGVRTLQRNALIALGNCGNPQAVPHILPFLRHEREELRISAAWALSRLQTAEGRAAVAAAYQEERSEAVREEMAWALDGTAAQHEAAKGV
ncbi:tRNA epoxyqueuosine(34) reductase QueG [Alicyclobacillus cycloheptanicus]|nr:tRNA epoxyqueuosine(34) reductase QueG [Alicyclobacillus cycloheptanicus]